VLVNPNTGKSTTMKEAREEFGAKSVVISYSRLRLNETSLEDALQTRMQPKRVGLERLHRFPAMGAKLAAAKAAEEMSDPDFLAKTFMTCLSVTRGQSLALTNATRAGRSWWSSRTTSA
jgi:hypothetical protein